MLLFRRGDHVGLDTTASGHDEVVRFISHGDHRKCPARLQNSVMLAKTYCLLMPQRALGNRQATVLSDFCLGCRLNNERRGAKEQLKSPAISNTNPHPKSC